MTTFLLFGTFVLLMLLKIPYLQWTGMYSSPWSHRACRLPL